MWPRLHPHLPPKRSLCNYSSYNNNHSQSFPIYRYFPHAFQAIPCYTYSSKKPSLDKDTLNNYRPISNLSLISKITERIVKSRLNEHLSSNSQYNPNQSAYTKYHSNRNYSFVLNWPPHYSNKPSTSLIPLPSWPFFCLWHHRSLNSTPSSLILVRYCRFCPYMVRNLLNISLLLWSCLWFRITTLSPFLWRTPMLCPWPYPFQYVHHTSQHSHLILVIKSSPLCWWHSNIYLICT